MSQPVAGGWLRIAHLSKSYGPLRAVDDVSFNCQPGTITGFLGPNGSGKSTTLRMLVGHTRPSSGSTTFDGRRFVDLPQPGRVVGVLLDASAQHPGRSVWETARLASLVVRVGRERTRECLAAVGLSGVMRKRVGSLSLGMRQRLGLAIAILGFPRFLILDEPANGLDPEGIRWLREFLLTFASHGGTVLVSSHQLSEIEAMADQLIIIDRGRATNARSLLAEVHDPVSLAVSENDQVLHQALLSSGITVLSQLGTTPLRAQTTTADLGRLAFAAGIALTYLAPEKVPSLEDRFLTLTSGEYAGLSSEQLFHAASGKPRQ